MHTSINVECNGHSNTVTMIHKPVVSMYLIRNKT